MQYKKINEEVLYTTKKMVNLVRKDLDMLKQKAALNKHRRIRFCAHKDIDALLHEMFVVHTKGTYVKPHKHLKKVESLHIISGKADLIFFKENGEIFKITKLGDYASGLSFYARVPENTYHTLYIHTDHIIFHETVTGPFIKKDNIFPSWAPDETKIEHAKRVMKKWREITI